MNSLKYIYIYIHTCLFDMRVYTISIFFSYAIKDGLVVINLNNMYEVIGSNPITIEVLKKKLFFSLPIRIGIAESELHFLTKI